MKRKILVLVFGLGIAFGTVCAQTTTTLQTNASDSLAQAAQVVNITNNYYQTPEEEVIVHPHHCHGLFCNCALHTAVLHYHLWRLERKVIRLF